MRDRHNQTVTELAQAIPTQEQMIISILAASWQPHTESWNRNTLVELLQNFARDVSTNFEHRIAAAVPCIISGKPVEETLSECRVIGGLTFEALKVTAAKSQLSDFFGCWMNQALTTAELVPHERTVTAKLVRLGLTGAIILNVLFFVMLFIIPEFQKMFEEFGLELTGPTSFMMIWAERIVRFWFILGPVMLLIGILFVRGASFATWWRRWSPRSWTVNSWDKHDRRRLALGWAMRAGPRPDLIDLPASKFDATATLEKQLCSARILTKRESAALSATDDGDLKDWLLEKMIDGRRTRRVRNQNVVATILIGAGHCFLALVVVLVAVSILGSLLVIVEGLAGARP